MELGRVQRDTEAAGDGLVGGALGEQGQHLGLSRCESEFEVIRVAHGLRAGDADIGVLAGRRHPRPGYTREQRRETIGESCVTDSECDDDDVAPSALAQRSGLSPTTRSTARVSPPRLSATGTVVPTLAGPSARSTSLSERIG